MVCLTNRQCLWVVTALFLLLSPGRLLAQDDVEVAVTINRDTIGLDEQAMLEVKIVGASQNLPQPKIPSLAAFEVYSQGQSSNISIVNGQVSASVTHRYMLLPVKSGTFPISGVAVVHNNHRYEGNAVEITVLNTGTVVSPTLEDNAVDSGGVRRDYFMEALVDKANPFVNEQVTLTLKIYFAIQVYGSPELSEPTTTGFWTEILGNKAPYYPKIQGRNYKVIERKYALFPTQTGTLSIGRSMISATIASRSRRQDPFDVFGMFGRGEEIRMHSQALEINVRPLPEKGKPGDFTGTIGKFNIQASANRSQVEVNQPVSVTYRINGTGNIKSVAEPTLPQLDDFRVYRASSSESISKIDDKIGGTKIFEEVFIPNKPGQLTIPAVSFNYFDPEKQTYRVISTRPVIVQVSKPEDYAGGADVPYAAPSVTIGAGASDIRYIKEASGDLREVGQLILFSPIYIVINSLPVLLLAGTVVMRRRRERLVQDVGYARSRAASRMARKRLVRAKSLANEKTSADFYAELASSLTSFVADKLNISPHGLTSDQLAILLNERSADEYLVHDTVRFLQGCDFARYTPGTSTLDKINRALGEAEEIIVRIEGVNFG
ncbi:MAG: BatD family protein [Planctomycetota bacterium]